MSGHINRSVFLTAESHSPAASIGARVARRLTPRPVVVQVFNVFLGAMLGGAPPSPVHCWLQACTDVSHPHAKPVSCAGSIFGQIRVALNDPTRIPSVLGAALPASSNFFVSHIALQPPLSMLILTSSEVMPYLCSAIYLCRSCTDGCDQSLLRSSRVPDLGLGAQVDYICAQAFLLVPFRFFFIHAGVLPWILRSFGMAESLPSLHVRFCDDTRLLSVSSVTASASLSLWVLR